MADAKTERHSNAGGTRTYSEREIAFEAQVPVERVAWLDSLGVLPHHERGGFTFGSILVTKLIAALLDAGVSVATVEVIVAERWFDSGRADNFLPYEPQGRATRPFEEFQARMGRRGALLPTLYRTLGLPPPDPFAPIHTDEEEMLERFLDGWRLVDDDDVLLRAARLLGEGTRVAMVGWVDLINEQISTPARRRLFRGEIDRFPDEASDAFRSLTDLLTEMFSWLGARYLEQRMLSRLVESLEELLASRHLAPLPPPAAPPAIVFVDISAFTQLTERHGDETAAVMATVLQRQADSAATDHDGRLVKMLGDGALLRLPNAKAGVEAALDLVERMKREGLPSAHAGIDTGPIVERDLDVFGRTVNLAARIADQARPGEVLASGDVAAAAEGPTLNLECLEERSLKGIPGRVALFKITRGTDRTV